MSESHRRGVLVGAWSGIPVRADWSALVALALFAWVLSASVLPVAVSGRSAALYWTAGTATAVLFFVALVVHELTHAVVARRFGLRVRGLTLWMLGGYTELDAEPATPRAEGWVAVSGPLVSIAIGVVAVPAAVLGGRSLLGASLGWLAVVNVVLGVFNLLPGAPLDGGRVLRAVLWARWGDRDRATRAEVRAGRAVGAVLVGLGCVQILAGALTGIWLALIGWYVIVSSAAQAGAATLEPVRGLRVEQVAVPVAVVAPDWWTVERLVRDLGTAALDQRLFPLVDFAGGVSGYVTIPDLAKVAAAQRGETPLRTISGAVHGRTLVLRPDAIVGDVWEDLVRHRGVGIVTDEHGVPVGAVTDAELRRAGQLMALGWQRTSGGNRP